MFTVIMCGGSGTRFWPVSRKTKPKQFLNIAGNDPMVVETCNRLHPVTTDEEMILVLGKAHQDDATTLFSGRGVHMLAEPVGRNTAPCIGLGAIYARYLGCKGSVAFLPADHFIGDVPGLLESLSSAGTLAEAGGIITLGIVPSRPETGYGYIRSDQVKIDSDGFAAYGVTEFVEKPDIETAVNYLKTGGYYWNAGIFVATPDTILNEIEKLLPDLYEGLIRLERAMGSEKFEAEFDAVYEGLEGVSFDYGIMEKTQEKVFVVPCECGWSDVGSWASLYDLRADDSDANKNVTDGETLLVDCKESFISARSKRLVTCLGLRNLLVVDTPDTLLVADLDRSQDIREIVDQLKNNKKEELL